MQTAWIFIKINCSLFINGIVYSNQKGREWSWPHTQMNLSNIVWSKKKISPNIRYSMISFKSLRQNQQSHRILYLSSRNTDRCVRSWRVWCTGVNGSGGVACCPNLGTETRSVNTLQTSFFFFFLDSHLFSSHLSLHTADVLIRESWAL